MAASSSFQNDKTHIAEDPNSGSDVKPVSIFSSDYKKHSDLKQMLDSNKESMKLDAMKRIVGMIAKGKNASDLFPAVVKNVVSKNVEIKKLVYVYLMRYAEEQQDLALLSISTFQRALKDPNQLIRASALRVLSSIRVPLISGIVMLGIKEAVTDMSPYVRKTAANAITKLYSIDPDLKDELIDIIEKLLADKTILVVGSAIQAFEEVCPERIDLIHKNYRKLCNLLIDVDEWGQVVIINMLTRYARTQFLDPNRKSDDQDKKDSDNDEENEEDQDEDDYDRKFGQFNRAPTNNLDPDHRLLLRVTKPLLQSRNSAVVMAVAQLYYYVAPASEVQLVAKSLVRLLRSHREIQIIVLKNIVSMAQKNQQMFQQHQKSFYVHSNDSIQVKLLKLEILTSLANEANISVILREFQAYVLSEDKDFAAATIHAIGRCASSIKGVADNCLTGLVNLMSKRDETIVGESVVVIKRLLQSNPSKNGAIIKKMAKMAEKVTVPMARASILWLIGEYSDRVSKIAPDVLRKMVKTFCDEENVVKLQILNLGVKLYIANPKQVNLLVQYMFSLAKYDQNYDIRDRARFLRTLLLNSDEACPNLGKHVKRILLAPKPAPVLQSAYRDSDQFQLGTLSHAISARCSGYYDLPPFPTVAPDPAVRNVEVPRPAHPQPQSESRREHTSTTGKSSSKAKSDKFYSDDENVQDDDDDEKSQSTEGADPTNEEDEEESSESDESEEESSESEDEGSQPAKAVDSEVESDEEDSEVESEDEESETEPEPPKKSTSLVKPVTQAAKPSQEVKKPVQSVKKPANIISSSEDSTKESSSEESESEESETDSEPPAKPQKPAAKQQPPPKPAVETKEVKPKKKVVAEAPKEVSLLDLDFNEPTPTASSTVQPTIKATTATNVLSPSLADLANLTSSSSTSALASAFQSSQQVASTKEYELLSKINGNGLQIKYRYSRQLHIQSTRMLTVQLTLTNVSSGDFGSLTVSNKKLQSGMQMLAWSDEFDLANGATKSVTIGIDFNDTMQPAQFEISGIYSNDPHLGGTTTTRKWPNLSITCPIGEMVQPGWSISESEFNRLQAGLKGMNEVSGIVDELTHALYLSRDYNKRLLESINMCQIPSSHQDTIKYAALTWSTKTPLLLTLFFVNSSGKCHVNVNCEKIVLANMFVKEIKQLLQN